MSSMNKHSSFYYCIFLLAVAIRTAVAQTPAPAPPGPPNITAILEKGGQFGTLIRLMGTTQVGDQINQQLNDTNNGMTIIAPSDSAFQSLQAGTLNGLNNQDQVSLIQFHIIPTFLPPSQFQTASNPLRTQAGDSGPYAYPLNVTTNGSQVILSSGVDNTTIGTPFYSDGQLAVYQVDKVLLPMSLFGAKAPAPAPAPAETKKKKATSTRGAKAPSSSIDASGDMGLRENAVVLLFAAAVAGFWL